MCAATVCQILTEKRGSHGQTRVNPASLITLLCLMNTEACHNYSTSMIHSQKPVFEADHH